MNQTAATPPPFYLVVPAAGSGRRFGADIPKQYLALHGCTIAEHTLSRLLSLPGLQQVVVAIAENDKHFARLPVAREERVTTVVGGRERSDSVLNALQSLSNTASDSSWVLVHDIARPCCPLDDILRLCASLQSHPIGGLLASPVTDTVKSVRPDHSVAQTLDRSEIWLAQTPQMFRLGVLRRALEACRDQNRAVTDEASALEQQGHAPVVVAGSRCNLKITHAEDLPLAAFYLQQLNEQEAKR